MHRTATPLIALLLAVAALPAAAHVRDPETRLDRRGDRIEARLDRRGDRIEHRLDHRAAMADAHGRHGRADRLEARGDRLDTRLDRRGERADRRLDRRGHRIGHH